MANVCLIRLPFFKIHGIEKVHFPLSIGYLAAYLEKGGHKVSFIDGEAINYGLYEGLLHKGIINAMLFYADPHFIYKRSAMVSSIMENENVKVWNILIEKIAQTKPDIIGISCYTVNMTAANILTMKSKREIGNIPVVLGGIHPTSLPQKTLEEIRSADYVVVGEGEESFLDLINSLDKKGQLYQPIDGVVSRGSNNFKPRKLIQNLDSIPFSCTFCASHLTWTRKVRYRSVENVINELKAIKIKFNAKRIRILDDTFILNKKWVMEFCNALKKNNMQFTFNCSGRIDTVDEELLKVLYESGFDSISFGIESGSPRILKKIKKGIDLSKVVDIIKLANKYGFDTTSFYMTGHHGETLEDIKMSENLFKISMSKRGDLSMLVPYSKTEIGDEAERLGFKFGIDNYYKLHHVRNKVLFNMTKLSDEELLAEHNRFERIIRWRNYKTLVKKFVRLILYSVTK